MIQKYMNSQFFRKGNLRPYFPTLLGGLLIACLNLPTQAATIFVNTKGGNDSNTGLDTTQPLRTVTKGVAVANANGGGIVHVAVGKYDESPITLPAGVTISGGWDNTFAEGKRNIFDNTKKIPTSFEEKLCEDHTCLTTTTGPYVISTMGSQSGTVKPETLPPRSLSQLIIIGPNCATPPGNAHCDSSFGVIVDQPNVHLDYLLVKAGTGNTGIKGQDAQGTTGTCTRGGAGGKVSVKITEFSASCEGGTGETGESAKLNDVVVALGGKGGETGENNCSVWPKDRSDTAETGKTGEKGNPGATGRSGIPASIVPLGFSFANNRLELNHNTSGNGGPGSPGAGGGGGGAGGSWNYFFWGCVGAYPTRGGVGHDGNRGGCGGAGGLGGSSGAGAFALVINNVKVMSEGLVLLGGQGGMGGAGGNGALGAPGGKDDSLGTMGTKAGPRVSWDCFGSDTAIPSTARGGTGGAGGHGGDGGDGGGGAGGNGGPAISLVTLAKNAALEVKSGGTYHVKGGRAGIGGTGGKNGACIKNPQMCVTANTGSGGNPTTDPSVGAGTGNPLSSSSSTSNIVNGLEGINQESVHLP